MAHTLTWHETEDRISIVIRLLLLKFMRFCLSVKGVKLMKEIIKISLAISVCKLCQVGVVISSINYITAD